jgi:hypothetical protein
MIRHGQLDRSPERDRKPSEAPPVREARWTPSTVLALQRTGAGNHAISRALLQRIHFGATRGVGESYRGEEQAGGPRVGHFAEVLAENVNLAHKIHQAIEQAEEGATTILHPSDGKPAGIEEMRTFLTTRRQTWRQQFPDAFGDIPDDWDFADKDARLARARPAMEPGVARPGDSSAYKVTLGPTLTRAGNPGGPASTVDSSTFVRGPGWEIFVLSWTGDLYMASHKLGQFHHSSLLSGSDVAAAGEIRTDASGKILELTDKSGHYQPGDRQLQQLLYLLKKRGVPLDFNLRVASGAPAAASESVNETGYRSARVDHAWDEAWAAFPQLSPYDPAHVKELYTRIAKAQPGWTVAEQQNDAGSEDDETEASYSYTLAKADRQAPTDLEVRRAIKTMLGRPLTPQASWANAEPAADDHTAKRRPG